MPNEPKPIQPIDPGRINLLDPIELRYWCEELDCKESELRDTAAKVGEHVAAVRQQLHAKRH